MYIYTHTQPFLVQHNILYPSSAQEKENIYILKALVFRQVCLAFLCRDGEKALGLTAEVAAAVIISD